MTSADYIKPHIKKINNHITVEEIPKGGPFCETCFDTTGELVKAPFDQSQNGWVCPHGHIGPNQPLAHGIIA